MRYWTVVLSIVMILVATLAPAAIKSITVVSKAPKIGSLTLYQNSWAVLIGINDYQNKEIPDLQFAEKDVADMRRSLVKLGFPSKQILTLTGRKATRRNIQRLLGDRLPQKVGQNDRVIIYFSGHGKDESVGGREVGYLIPVKNYLLRGAIAIMSSSSRAPGELKP
ncbi:MAG: caspase family protein [Nitrospinota bacterium]|nr:caspase family protein [Nitrospinota bacterium]